MTSLKTEELNYLRLIRLVSGVAVEAVRVKFDQIFPPSTLTATLQKNKKKLGAAKWVNSAQTRKMFPPGGSVVNSNDFDVTLMIALIRNLAPSVTPPGNGFDKLPPATEVSVGADLARIKHFRNMFAHSQKSTVDIVDFNAYWSDIAGAVVRLGGQSFQTQCDSLAKETLDRDIILEFRSELDEVKDDIKDIQEARKVPREERKKKLLDDTQILVETQAKDKTFVETKVIDDGLRCLREDGVVVLVGPAGCGKTRNSLHLLRKFRVENPDVQMVQFDQLVDLTDFVGSNDCSVVLLDDIFGKTNCLYNEKTDAKVMEKVLSYVEKGNIKIIITTRNTIKRHCESLFTSHRLFSKRNIIDLTSPSYKLSIEDKSEFLVKYFQQRFENSKISREKGFIDADGKCRITFDEADAIVHTDPLLGFPQTVFMFMNNDNNLNLGRFFFKRPSMQTVEEINSIRQRGHSDKSSRIQYAILALTFFCGNRINPSLDQNAEIIKKIIKQIFGIDDVITPVIIIDTVKQFDRVYLLSVPGERSYTFQNQVIFESVLLSIFELDIKEIIPFLDLVTIYEMVRGHLYVIKEGEVVLTVPACCYEALAKRVVGIYSSSSVIETRQKILDCLFKAELFHSCGEIFVQYCLDQYMEFRGRDISDMVFYQDVNTSIRQLHMKMVAYLPVALLQYFAQHPEPPGLFLVTLEFINKILEGYHSSDPEEKRACRGALVQSVYFLCGSGSVDLIENVIHISVNAGIVISDSQIQVYDSRTRSGQADIIFAQECICRALLNGNYLAADFILSKYTDEGFDILKVLHCMNSTKNGAEIGRVFLWLLSKFDDAESKIELIKQSIAYGADDVLKSEWAKPYVGIKDRESMVLICVNHKRFDLFEWVQNTGDIEQSAQVEILKRLLPTIVHWRLLLVSRINQEQVEGGTSQEQAEEQLCQLLETISIDRRAYVVQASRQGDFHDFEVVKWFFVKYPEDDFPVEDILNDACCIADEEMVTWILTNLDHTRLDFSTAMICAISGSLVNQSACYVSCTNYNKDEDGKRLPIVKLLWENRTTDSLIDVSTITRISCENTRFKILAWILKTIGNEKIEIDVRKEIVKLSFKFGQFEVSDLLLEVVISPDDASEYLFLLVADYNYSSCTLKNPETLPNSNPFLIWYKEMKHREEVENQKRKEITLYFLRTFDHDILGLGETMRRCLLSIELFCTVELLLENCRYSYFNMQDVLEKSCKYAKVQVVREILSDKKYKHLDKSAAMISCSSRDMDCGPDAYKEDRIRVMNMLWKYGNQQNTQFDRDAIILASLANPEFEMVNWIFENFGKTKHTLSKMIQICCREAYIDMLKYIFYKCGVNKTLNNVKSTWMIEVCRVDSHYPYIFRGHCSTERVAIVQFFLKAFGLSLFKDDIPKAMKMALENKLFDVILCFLEHGLNGNANIKELMKITCSHGELQLVSWLSSNYPIDNLGIDEAFISACQSHQVYEADCLKCIIFLTKRFEDETFPMIEGYKAAKESDNKNIAKWIKSNHSDVIDDECSGTSPSTTVDLCMTVRVESLPNLFSFPENKSDDNEALVDRGDEAFDEQNADLSHCETSMEIRVEAIDSGSFEEIQRRRGDHSTDDAVVLDNDSRCSSPEYYYDNGLETEV